MAISDYSTSAASNLLLGTIPIGPGMEREKVNNAFQQLMADIATRDAQIQQRENRISLFEYIPTALQSDITAKTSTTDVSTYIQDAIDAAAGREIYAPPGKYRVTTALVPHALGSTTYTPGVKIFGAGPDNTIFEGAVTNSGLLNFQSATVGKFYVDTQLAGFTLQPHAVVTGSRGIDMKGLAQGSLSSVAIRGYASDGVRVISVVGDAGGGDSTAKFTLDGCDIRANGGYAVNTALSTNIIHALFFTIKNSFIWFNLLGGVNTGGHFWTIENTSVAYNQGSGGLVISDFGSAPQFIKAINCEFDGNVGQHIFAERVFQALFEDCQFNFQDNSDGLGFGPTKLLNASPSGKECQNIHFVRPRIRSNPTNPTSATTLWTLGTGITGFQVNDPFYQSFSGANAINYAGLGAVQDERRNGAWRGLRKAIHTDTTHVPAVGYAPDMRNGPYHSLVVTTTDAGNIYINTPLNPADGTELTIELTNASGGAITVTFDSAYLVNGSIAPATSKRRTGMFVYSPGPGKWVQQGTFSGDL